MSTLGKPQFHNRTFEIQNLCNHMNKPNSCNTITYVANPLGGCIFNLCICQSICLTCPIVIMLVIGNWWQREPYSKRHQDHPWGWWHCCRGRHGQEGPPGVHLDSQRVMQTHIDFPLWFGTGTESVNSQGLPNETDTEDKYGRSG